MEDGHYSTVLSLEEKRKRQVCPVCGGSSFDWGIIGSGYFPLNRALHPMISVFLQLDLLVWNTHKSVEVKPIYGEMSLCDEERDR